MPQQHRQLPRIRPLMTMRTQKATLRPGLAGGGGGHGVPTSGRGRGGGAPPAEGIGDSSAGGASPDATGGGEVPLDSSRTRSAIPYGVEGTRIKVPQSPQRITVPIIDSSTSNVPLHWGQENSRLMPLCLPAALPSADIPDSTPPAYIPFPLGCGSERPDPPNNNPAGSLILFFRRNFS